MRIALVHDHLCGMGGSERIFQYLCEEFTEADVYTLAFNPASTLSYFSSRRIRTTWMNRWIRTSEAFRWSFPLAASVMRHLDLTSYDVVLSSSATTAKYVKTPKGGHICYCYIPTRALWHTDQYFGKSFKRFLIQPFLNYLKQRDFRVAQGIDRFIAISQSSRGYIQQYYKRDAEVVYCPIDTHRFRPSGKRGDHYLLVSRLETWKKVDYAIEAFNSLGKPLRIVGSGAEEARLKKLARPNISFMGSVNDEELAQEYAACKAVVFTPFLEYGLIPLEANAAGAPVICYGKGGVEETMIPSGGSLTPTAVFFYEQTADALAKAVAAFETESFSEQALVRHASQWSIDAFKKKMRKAVAEHSFKKDHAS